MYTIFINESVIYLVEKRADLKVDYMLNYADIQIKDIIDKVESNEWKSVCIYTRKLKELWRDFKSQFTVIEAAGGLVFNEKNETLWIYRHDTWDLPKGKVEKNENLDEAAIREVKEECGVTRLRIVCPIEKTYHVYEHKGKHVLKITHWYKMYTDSNQKLKPQLEEHITQVVWMNTVKMRKALENTYDNIKLLCKFAAL